METFHLQWLGQRFTMQVGLRALKWNVQLSLFVADAKFAHMKSAAVIAASVFSLRGAAVKLFEQRYFPYFSSSAVSD